MEMEKQQNPTSGNEHLHKPKKRIWLYWLGGVVASCLFFIMFVMIFGIGPFDVPAQSKRLDEVMAESKRLGLPMTQADLMPAESVADSDNAAIEVMALAEEVGRTTVSVNLAYYAPDASERADLEKAFQVVDPFLDRIIFELDSKSGWYIEKDYDLGPNVMFPEYAQFKNVAKYLSIRSSLKADKGDVEGALTDLRAALKLRTKLKDDPVLIGVLVAIACDAIALRSSEQNVTLWADDELALTELETVLADSYHKIDPRLALKGEFYMTLSIMRNIEAYGGWQGLMNYSGSGDIPVVSADKFIRSGLPDGMFARAFLSASAQFWNEVFQRFEGQTDPPRNWGDAVDVRLTEMEEDLKMSEILIQILIPMFSQVDQSLQRNDVSQDLHMALVRVMKFRAENGHLPESLEEADASFPDPFNEGSSIKAILTEEEVRIWSIGIDNVDDLGLFRTMSSDNSDDIAVFWPITKRDEHRLN